MHRYLVCALFLSVASAQTSADLKEQVRKTEIAFARTMADRDAAGFRSFLSEEAIFVGRSGVLRGAKAELSDVSSDVAPPRVRQAHRSKH